MKYLAARSTLRRLPQDRLEKARARWKDQDPDQQERILRPIESFGLSLSHDTLTDDELLWSAQTKMIEKRGVHLAAPLPQHSIGQYGYLHHSSPRNSVSNKNDKRCRKKA